MRERHPPFRREEAVCSEAYATAKQVRRRYGGISDMTLWRWCRDERLAFPKPITIHGRRFWRYSELGEWELKRLARGR